LCGSKNLVPILSLGNQYVVNFIDAENQEQIQSPIDLVLCDTGQKDCGLLQLKHTFSQEKMYQQYWYRSGINKTMTDELHGIARTAESMVSLKPGDYVIDIGSNDSTMLRKYTANIKSIGFEPAKNLVEKYGREGVTDVITDFFNYQAWNKKFGDAKAKIITAIAMFYDLDNPKEFVAEVAKCLDDEGVFIVQQNYLPYMLERNIIDNVSHEHLAYYSLTTFKRLMDQQGLEIFDIELNDVNGGSMRTYIRHKGKGSTIKIRNGAGERVNKVLEEEKAKKLDKKEIYEAFASRIHAIREKLFNFVKNEVEAGKKIYAYGASTRGNTMLQFCNIDYKLITAAADRNPDKWGKRMVGTNIPIISEEEARAQSPDHFLILPWQFLPEFIEREREFFKRGGKFIVALPEFRIIES